MDLQNNPGSEELKAGQAAKAEAAMMIFFWTPKSSWLNMKTVSSLEMVDDVNGIVDPTLC
jgi:hypothetical protein